MVILHKKEPRCGRGLLLCARRVAGQGRCLRGRKAFTLIELVLVIGIISILSAIVILSINPRKQLIMAFDAKRAESVNQLQKALSQYSIDQNQTPGNINIPNGAANASPVCRLSKGDAGCVSLDELLPTYLGCIPYDPAEPNLLYSGFSVYQDAKRLYVKSLYPGVNAVPTCENPTYPVAYWKFDESAVGSSGKNFMNSQSPAQPKNFQSPQGPTSAFLPVTRFHDSYSLDFDGANDYLTIPTTSALDVNKSYTITAWIYVDVLAASDYGVFMRTDNAGGNELGISVESSHKLSGHVDGTLYNSNSNLVAGVWTHIAMVRNNSTLTFYINGVANGGGNPANSLNFNGCNSMVIGAEVSAGCIGGIQNYFNGKIDDLRIYNTVLTATQIQALANGFLW